MNPLFSVAAKITARSGKKRHFSRYFIIDAKISGISCRHNVSVTAKPAAIFTKLGVIFPVYSAVTKFTVWLPTSRLSYEKPSWY